MRVGTLRLGIPLGLTVWKRTGTPTGSGAHLRRRSASTFLFLFSGCWSASVNRSRARRSASCCTLPSSYRKTMSEEEIEDAKPGMDAKCEVHWPTSDRTCAARSLPLCLSCPRPICRRPWRVRNSWCSMRPASLGSRRRRVPFGHIVLIKPLHCALPALAIGHMNTGDRTHPCAVCL